MVIDTNLDKLAPLIPKKDQMLQLTVDYESFMYYCNVLSNLISDGNNLHLDLPIIQSHVDSLSVISKKINDNITVEIKVNDESTGKLKLISNNINNAIEEIIIKFSKLKRTVNDIAIIDISNKMESIHTLTTELNHNVSKEIMHNELYIPNRPSSQESEIGMFITVVCVVLFVIIIGVVSYIKVSGE